MVTSALLMLVVMIGASCGGGSGQSSADVLSASLVRYDGTTLTLGDLKGRPTVVAFFASWCVPCRKELPEMELAYKDLGGQVQFLGVSAEGEEEKSRELLENLGVTFDAATDIGGDLMAGFQVSGLPATFLLDAEGAVAERFTGAMTEESVLRSVATHFGLSGGSAVGDPKTGSQGGSGGNGSSGGSGSDGAGGGSGGSGN